ncbi:hypothetical protein GALL_464900 [mine drainage metagenome]|uniref:Uncharacterized protein n=1 Tax=mine drainage metagenome TaxID=410659 RepID=A0A1J5PM60_9ZZZZ
MSSGVATPSSTRRLASSISAAIKRVVTNPATSRLTTMDVLPSRCAKWRAFSSTSSLVCSPRTNSHNFIMGTGEKKCVPITRSGCSTKAAICVIGSALVLLARITSLAQSLESSLKIPAFTWRSSKTASTTIEAPVTAFVRSVVKVMPLRTSSRSASEMVPFFTKRWRLDSIALRAKTSRSSSTSCRCT